MYENFRYKLKSLKNRDENNQYNKELISLFSSSLFNKENEQNIDMNLIKDLLTKDINKKNEKNLLNEFINEKVNIKRNTLNRELLSNSYPLNNNKNNFNLRLNDFDNKNKEKETFLNRMNIIGKIPTLKKNEKDNNLGKSLNDNLIKNIKDEMIKKGILIQKPLTQHKGFKKEKIPGNNLNNFDFHIKVFKSRIIKEFQRTIKDFESSQKKVLKNFSEDLAYKKDTMTKQIPIYIKGFKKNGKDVFHSRKLFDMQYQKKYKKPSINLEELIQNHNQYSTFKFKKGKISFYHFLRTVNNPYQNLKVAPKRINSGNIFIQFKGNQTKNNKNMSICQF